MATVDAVHVQNTISRYRDRDPELYAELQAKLHGNVDEHADRAVESLNLSEGLPLVDETGDISPAGQRVVETIVRPNARPVLVIRDNKVTTEFLGPDSEVWAERINKARPILDRVVPSVGRIEVKNNPDFSWLGTGWLIADDIIVTNRHVANEFARRGDAGFVFKPGLNQAAQSARIDFREEYQRSLADEVGVESILWIADSREPDVAFLRLNKMPQGSSRRLRQLPLASTMQANDFVAAIGYPARDSRVPDQDLVRRIFGDVYEKKRLAPGQLLRVADDELEHDCSTLGGNSGSVLVNLTTGEAVGLHHSGLFLEANFAVPAKRLNELLTSAQTQRSVTDIATKPLTRATSNQRALPPSTANRFTFQVQVPIEITVSVGQIGSVIPSVGGSVVAVAAGTRASFEQALEAARVQLGGQPEVLDVRLGYRFKNGWITDEQVVVVEVREKRSLSELRESGVPPFPSQIMGIGVDVRTAGMVEQLQAAGVEIPDLEAVSKAGAYREPLDLALEPVKEQMRAVFHVSPDSGFPNLKAFLGRVDKHLTATIYEWEADHISDAIAAAMKPAGNRLRMVTQPKIAIAEGTEDAVADMRTRIGKKFSHVFASVGSGKLIPSAYHIKVASRDGEEFWLSSGNWKDSNQANIDPAGQNSTDIGPLRKHNREWHAIIENAKLATLFQKYIEFDFAEAKRVPFDEGVVPVLPDVFVPETAFLEEEAVVKATYFDPLELNRVLDIQPLLTPDRDGHHRHIYIQHATAMAEKAKERIYVQNQSFTVGDDNGEYEKFFATLLDKQNDGLDVRIIFRDPRQFPHGAETLQKTLERIKDFGLDTDKVKVQRGCHTKGIVVDATEVVLGSQNHTMAGSLFNRDASLLVRDPEVAAYFEKIFLFDWNVLATQTADEAVGGMRLARTDEAVPAGFRRVSVAELLGLS